jgi:hypothetical protein
MSKLSKISNFLSLKNKRQDTGQWLIDVDKDLQQLYSALNNYLEVNKLKPEKFYLRRVSQSAQPTPSDGELLLWRDTDDDKTYLVYDDEDVGTRKIELT